MRLFTKWKAGRKRRSLYKRARVCERCAGDGRFYIWNRREDRTELTKCYECDGFGYTFDPTFGEIIGAVYGGFGMIGSVWAFLCRNTQLDAAVAHRMKG